MNNNWLEVGAFYVGDNGNIGLFNGKWTSSPSGIKFVLEDVEGFCVGFIKKSGNIKMSELRIKELEV